MLGGGHRRLSTQIGYQISACTASSGLLTLTPDRRNQRRIAISSAILVTAGTSSLPNSGDGGHPAFQGLLWSVTVVDLIVRDRA